MTAEKQTSDADTKSSGDATKPVVVYILAGVALGLALTTRVHAVFAPVVGWTWLARAAPSFGRRDARLHPRPRKIYSGNRRSVRPARSSRPRLASRYRGPDDHPRLAVELFARAR